MHRLPLEGIRVIEYTVVWAGPFACMYLADMGAEVIRVESPNFFPPIGTRGISPTMTKEQAQMMPLYRRGFPESDPGERPYDLFVGYFRSARNKLSCCIDIKRSRGMEMFKKLVQVSDIFIENFQFGTMDKLGISYETMSQWNPNIIYISSSSYGSTGPYRRYVGFGDNVGCVTGHHWLRGYPDENHPMHPILGLWHADAAQSASIAFAALVALNHRNRTGEGQYIDAPSSEAELPHLADALMDYSMNQRIQRTLGNRDQSAAPCGAYRCRGDDEWVVITVRNDTDWGGLCRALGSPPWTEEERFADCLSRYAHQDELDKLIEDWTRKHDQYAAMLLLQREGVPAAPVLNSRDIARDPQIVARGWMEPINHRYAGQRLIPGFLWKCSRTPMRIRKPPVTLGEDNNYVLRQLLGLSEQETTELETGGIVGDTFVTGYKLDG